MNTLLKYTAAITCFLIMLNCRTSVSAGDEPTAKEKRAVRAIGKVIDRAERLSKSKKYASSAEKIMDAQQQVTRLATGADAELIALIQPQYDRIAEEYKRLAEQGQEMDELPSLPPPIAAGGTPVSFKSEVAPVLVTNCGRCHVARRRGDFSAATYQSLMESTHVSTGLPDNSRLIEVIVDGDMPPGGKIADKDLETLKQWIAQGAKFDGENPGQDLSSLTGITATPERKPVAVAKPTGQETVSFGLQVAPLLVQNCARCHIDRNPAQGGLSMATFMQMLRGGESGNLLVPGDSNASQLMLRLRAEGVSVMPPGGKLDESSIDLIAKWIDEGAVYDGGPNAQLATKTVAAVAKANAQTHEQLAAERNALAIRNWKLIMSADDVDIVRTADIRVVGNSAPPRMTAVAERAQELVGKIVDTLTSDPQTGFIKGGITIYVFESRYDFNELGMMLVGRELPQDVKSHWNYDGIDAYAAVLLTRNESANSAAAGICQQMASIYVSTLAPDVPRWFADGIGHYAAAKILPRDEETKAWEKQAQQVVVQMASPGDFATGRLSGGDAALASYLFVKNMKSNGQLAKILKLMQNGSSFDSAFSVVFGNSPADFFRTPRKTRRRR